MSSVSDMVVLRRLTTVPASTHSSSPVGGLVAADGVAHLDTADVGVERRHEGVARRLGQTEPPGAGARVVERDHPVVDAHAGRAEAVQPRRHEQAGQHGCRVRDRAGAGARRGPDTSDG